MTIIGISMFKDEHDIAEGTIRHMSGEVDRLVVADNLSSDGTREILDRLAGESELSLTVVDDREPAYYQAQKMSALAASFAEPGDWIVPFDADELWYSRIGRISDVLRGVEDGPTVVAAKLFDHFGTALDERDPDVFRSFVWHKIIPSALPKVAFRYEPGAEIAIGNHGVTLASGASLDSCRRQTECVGLEIRHFPYRSPEQFKRKAINGANALKLTDLPRDSGLHWRGYGELAEAHGPEVLEQVYRDHFWYLVPWQGDMIYDPAPYCRWRS